jgi:hypothetical protein
MIGFKARMAMLAGALVTFAVAVYMASIRDFGAAVAVGCTALFFAIWALGAGVTDAGDGERVGVLWVESDAVIVLMPGDRLQLTDQGQIFVSRWNGVKAELKDARMGADHEFV